ncbi:YqgE/AlgH family protein [Actinotalea ferrariae]|uniref:YqgE/AlgH family protein n=1 Tax=Actinotalea ferrariae TaxID=1386098 RepID=UPI001C8B18BB|nr:YqgE/AlgH family protein [Actinotalea ferrariae]MBX9246502.1 YqgE/AlgH family protein [Actinotalea ferrariae]
MSSQRLTAGDLLVAVPHLLDPNFKRAVVLLLHHDDEGALGVVLNRPLSVAVGSVLPAWEGVVSEPASLFQGGPVGLDGALGVATLPAAAEPPPSVTRVAGSFGLVDLDADPDDVRGVLGLRVFAGHAGWGAGQLDEEVAAGDWFVFPALPSDAATQDPARLWRAVMRRQGGSMAIVSTFPDDPRLN